MVPFSRPLSTHYQSAIETISICLAATRWSNTGGVGNILWLLECDQQLWWSTVHSNISDSCLSQPACTTTTKRTEFNCTQQ